MVQVTVDKVGLEQDANQAVILLSDLSKTTYIPIWVRTLEASAIAMPLSGVSSPRPLTADLIIEVVKKLGGKMVKAVINDLRDDTFYASLILLNHDKEIAIDCRPSDALAVALRLEIPIFATEKVIAEAGMSAEDSSVQ